MLYRALERLGGLQALDATLYDTRPAPSSPDLTLRYLGTAGFVLEGAGSTIVIDPYVSRPGLRATLRPLVPNAELIRRVLPKADDVLVGHAHHDHVLDAPELCRQTGARLIGSRAVCNVGRAAGLPEIQLRETSGGEDIPAGAGTVRGLPSRHGRVYFDRVSLPGDIPKPPPWPPRFTDLRHGLVLNWVVELGGVRVLHIDSADFLPEHLEGVEADVLCLCAIGRRYRPGYTEEAIRLVRPRYVVPCHWDLFFTPLEAEPLLLPGVDLPGFLEEIRAAGGDPVLLPILGELGVTRGR